MRTAQTAIIRDLGAHQTANRSYAEEGVQLLELAQRAHVLFESQPATEKRKLLDFVLSNCTWKGRRRRNHGPSCRESRSGRPPETIPASTTRTSLPSPASNWQDSAAPKALIAASMAKATRPAWEPGR
jgi:hypothetical protein